MNNFTKEELENLRASLDVCIAKVITSENTEYIECKNCGRIFHELENSAPGYSDFCSICNSEWFDDNK